MIIQMFQIKNSKDINRIIEYVLDENVNINYYGDIFIFSHDYCNSIIIYKSM